jgi:acid phosphatase type 7
MRHVCGLLLAAVASATVALPPKTKPDVSQFAPTLRPQGFTSGRSFRLVAYGDSRFTDPAVTKGTNPRLRKWLAERVAQEHPAAILLTGDTPYTGANSFDWQVFQQETTTWRAAKILQLPTTGNHEAYGGLKWGIPNYLDNFPGISRHRYYSALLGNAEVISLDCTQDAGTGSPQAEWFAGQLAHLPTQVQFLFILYHIPWMVDRQTRMFVNLPSPEALNLRNILEEHLSGLHARVVVFNGHIHNYERFERQGVEYVVTGGGGAEPYPLLFRGRADLYRDLSFPVYHFVTMDVSDGNLHAVMWKVKDPDAPELSVEAKDQFTLTAPKQGTEVPKRKAAHR